MTEPALTVRFFARLREELGTDTLAVPPRPGLTTGDLLRQLAARGGAWRQLDSGRPVLVAVNRVMAKARHPGPRRRRGRLFPAGHRRLT